MKNKSELKALLVLLADSDKEVFLLASQRILELGAVNIPYLLETILSTTDERLKERLEDILNTLQYLTVKETLMDWIELGCDSLLLGAIYVSKFLCPNLKYGDILGFFEIIIKLTSKSLSSLVNPIDKINAVNKRLFVDLNFKANEVLHASIDEFLINRVVINRKGNSLIVGILYLSICSKLNIPIYAIKLPHRFILAYFDSINDLQTGTTEQIAHFIDPIRGKLYDWNDVNRYLTRMQLNHSPNYFHKQTNKEIIGLYISEMAQCYSGSIKDKKSIAELMSLAKLFI